LINPLFLKKLLVKLVKLFQTTPKYQLSYFELKLLYHTIISIDTMTDKTVQTATASNIKLEFLNGWAINIDKIPKYDEFEGDFYEMLDYKLSEIIINSSVDGITEEGKANFKNAIFDKLPPSGLNVVRHHNRHKLGRYYGDDNGSIIVQSRKIKHTLFQYMGYKDLDQKKSHPNIALMIGSANNERFTYIKGYILEYKRFEKIIIDHFSVKTGNAEEDEKNRLGEDEVKSLFNITLYGGGFKAWVEKTENGDKARCIAPKLIREDSKRFKDYEKSTNPDHAKFKLPSCYLGFKQDCERLKTLIIKHNPALEEAVRNDEKNKSGQERTAVSYFFQIIENHTLYQTYLYLVELKVIKRRWVCLEYDGLCLPRFVIKCDDNELVRKLNAHILELTGLAIEYKIKGYSKHNVNTMLISRRNTCVSSINYTEKTFLKEKAYYEYYELEDKADKTVADLKRMPVLYKLIEKLEKEEITQDKKLIKDAEKHRSDKYKKDEQEKHKGVYLANDDNDAGKYIFGQLHKDRLINAGGMPIFKSGNVWINDVKKIKNNLLTYIMESGVRKKTEDASVVYSANVKPAKDIRERLIAEIELDKYKDDQIYDKLHSTTIGKICFLDGVLDFKKQQFHTWDQVNDKNTGFECYTTMQIYRNYKEYFDNPDHDVIAEVKRKIFDGLFTNDVDKSLHFLSRALAGHSSDKHWGTYLGNRDCGKGVLYEGLKAGFGSYVNVFNLGNILYQRLSKQKEDTALSKYWLLDLEFTRLAISQETPDPEKKMKADGAKIKGLVSSGGDTQTARRNFETHDSKFKVGATVFIMGNNALDVDEKDALEHCVEFKSVNQYKTQADIDSFKAEGLPPAMWEGYKIADPTVKANCKTVEWGNAIVYLMMQHYKNTPVVVSQDKTNDDENAIPLRKLIFMKYKITLDENDYIPANEVEAVLGGCKKKIKNELHDIKVFKKRHYKEDYRKMMCYYGIKEISEEDEDAQELASRLAQEQAQSSQQNPAPTEKSEITQVKKVSNIHKISKDSVEGHNTEYQSEDECEDQNGDECEEEEECEEQYEEECEEEEEECEEQDDESEDEPEPILKKITFKVKTKQIVSVQ
jgi:hypothetical protein